MPDITTLVTTDGHLLQRSGTTITGVDPATLSGTSGTSEVQPFLAADLELIFGTPSLTTVSSSTRGWLMSDTATYDAVGSTWLVPTGWSTYDVEVLWWNHTTGTGNVTLRFDQAGVDAGTTINSLPYTDGTATTVAAGSQYVLTRTAVASGLAVPASRLVQFRTGRLGSNAADTKAGQAGLYGVYFTKAS